MVSMQADLQKRIALKKNPLCFSELTVNYLRIMRFFHEQQLLFCFSELTSYFRIMIFFTVFMNKSYT